MNLPPFLLVFLYAGVLLACSPQPSFPATTPSHQVARQWQGTLLPFTTGTATSTMAAPTALPEIPLTPAPTATPFTHIVVKDDSLLGIAIKYGVTLEDLKAANPDVDARMLSIGQVLIIPVMPGGEATQLSTPTPVKVHLEAPFCYPAADGSLACLVEALNDQPETLENLTVWFGLYAQDDSLAKSQVGVPPVNILNVGGRVPIIVIFLPPIPEKPVVRVDIVTSLTAEDLKGRYVPLDSISTEVQISTNGLSATIQGQFNLSAPASRYKGAAVAYDVAGRVVGLREWKADTGCQVVTPEPTLQDATSTPQACGPLPYEITVYSLGPEIEKVEILIEARP